MLNHNNILAIGINGTFPKAVNCNEIFMKLDGKWFRKINGEWKECEDQQEHHRWSLVNEVHAEMNALAKANKNGTSVEGATAYVTHSPCYNCAKNLYTFGIKRIVYCHPYDDIMDVKELLRNFDIGIVSMKDTILY